jgi:hypothetical protein
MITWRGLKSIFSTPEIQQPPQPPKEDYRELLVSNVATESLLFIEEIMRKVNRQLELKNQVDLLPYRYKCRYEQPTTSSEEKNDTIDKPRAIDFVLVENIGHHVFSGVVLHYRYIRKIVVESSTLPIEKQAKVNEIVIDLNNKISTSNNGSSSRRNSKNTRTTSNRNSTNN